MPGVKNVLTGLLFILISLAIIFGNAILSGQYSHADTSWTHGYKPCVTETDQGPCYWDATKVSLHSNGKGRSFVVTPDQRVIYR